MPTYDFEAGIDSVFRLSNYNPWEISTTSPYAGSQCLAAAASTADNEESQVTCIIDVTVAGTVSFRYKTDSEVNSDQLFCIVDGAQSLLASGTAGSWTLHTTASLSVGLHIIQWIYAKDGNTGGGADTVYIDEVILPAHTDFSGTLQNFPSGIPAGYVNDATYPWEADAGKGLFGSACIGSDATFANSSVSDLEYTVTCDAGDMFFAYAISSERGYDLLKFYIDGAEQLSVSGEYGGSGSGNTDAEACGWVIHKFTVASGSRVFRWEFSTDSSTTIGDNRGWIDALYIPESGGGGGATGKSNPLFGPLGGPLLGAIA